MKVRSIICVWVLCATLVGCGGGSDDAGGIQLSGVDAKVLSPQPLAEAASATPAVASTQLQSTKIGDAHPAPNKPLYLGKVVDVSIVDLVPASVTTTIYQGAEMPGLFLTGRLIGNIAALNGSFLYVVVEDPDGLFENNALFAMQAGSSPTVSLLLRGKTLGTAGTFSGALRISVCLDSGCQVRFRASPHLVPYTVKVLRGIHLSGGDLMLQSSFGAPPPVGDVTVTPPEGAAVSSLALYADSFAFPLSGSLSDNGNGTARLRFSLPPQTIPSSGSSVFWVSSSARTPSGAAPPSLMLTVKYAVAAEPAVLVAFTPNPTLALSVPLNVDPEQYRTTYYRVQAGQSNQTVVYEGIEWLLAPDQAASVPPGVLSAVLKIYDESNTSGTVPAPPANSITQRVASASCGFSDSLSGARDCLPSGTYAFRVRYTHRAWDGAPTAVYYYGQLNVTP
ncbi:hypothetical protein [Variovorax sp. Root434]|uniref:hypothetical protein n=1 Tax=Variovorax sp. Root434 TaxID=1736536 RepID=UPI0006FA66F9|nr:hypothetical protein [Variovorax sp. Root434]KQX22383.1 hypothetical protein ASD05_15715 [Variovorax sp. Root434]